MKKFLKNPIFLQGILGIIILGSLIGMFSAFQKDSIYHSTIGKFSQNYERTNSNDGYQINQVSKPFIEINNGYDLNSGPFNFVRGAFFPLLPFVWALTPGDTKGVCIFNYLLFVISIILLIKHFFSGDSKSKTILFIFSIILPSTIIYCIPYTESLFLFTVTIAVIGILKGRYPLYFIGIFLLAMTRPAAIFVFLSIGLIELIRLMHGLKFSIFIKELFFKLLPFIIGFFAVLFIQYLYTNSWTALIRAERYWDGKIQPVVGISDWSVEGFGLNVFSLLVICIPSFIFNVVKFFILPFTLLKEPIIKASSIEVTNEYLVLLATTYFSGIFLFTAIYSGGNIHSLFRFILTTPMFYIILILFFNKTKRLSELLRHGLAIIPIVSLFLFLLFTEYGGERFSYHLFGLFLFLFYYLFYIYHDKLRSWLQVSTVIVLGLFSIIWTTFLFNSFLSDGWIFT
jgi:hypothetical protein